MEHPRLRTGQFEPTDPGHVDATSIYDVHKVKGTLLQANLRLREEVLRKEQLLNSVFFLERHPRVRGTEGARSLQVLIEAASGARPLPSQPSRHLRAILNELPDLARAGTCQLRGTLDQAPRALLLLAMGEQAPNPDSRVTLSNRRDRLGLPKLRLDWRVTELDRRSILNAREIIDEELRSAGVGSIVRGQGVTNADGRVHDVSNLYVAGVRCSRRAAMRTRRSPSWRSPSGWPTTSVTASVAARDEFQRRFDARAASCSAGGGFLSFSLQEGLRRDVEWFRHKTSTCVSWMM